jgi:hypothetical protein
MVTIGRGRTRVSCEWWGSGDQCKSSLVASCFIMLQILRVIDPNRCLQMINNLRGFLGCCDHLSCLMPYLVNSVCLVCILSICKSLFCMPGPDPASPSGLCSGRDTYTYCSKNGTLMRRNEAWDEVSGPARAGCIVLRSSR